MQLLFAGSAAAATLALFGAAQPGSPAASLADHATPTISTGAGDAGRVIALNDDDVNNPSSGDIFTQNAQDQSTASGAGT
jgi:hypothetical protein